MSTGHQSNADIAHRIGIWGGMIGLAIYVMNIGAWVGAADEKFKDAETVEQKQETMLLQQNTIATKQVSIEKQLEKMEKKMDDDKKEILDAIREAHKDD